MRFRDGSDEGTASNFVRISEKVWRRPWQWLGKCSGKKAWAVLTETGKGETDEVQSQEHAHYFLWHQREYPQRTRPSRPNSQFHILLRCFTATAWKCAKTSPRTLATRKLVVASRQRTSHTPFFTREFFFPKTTWLSSPTHPTCLFPRLMIKIERPPFWHNRGDRDRIAGGTESPHRTRLRGCILKIGKVHTHGRGYFKGDSG
jgi:hypothetical protein